MKIINAVAALVFVVSFLARMAIFLASLALGAVGLALLVDVALAPVWESLNIFADSYTLTGAALAVIQATAALFLANVLSNIGSTDSADE